MQVLYIWKGIVVFVMSWKTSILIGLVLGCVLGGAAYVTLSRIGAELMVQEVTISDPLPIVEYNCGLEPVAVCHSLDYIATAQKNVPSDVHTSDLSVVLSEDMQPFGVGYEDEYTAHMAVQSNEISKPQVTWNGIFIQDASADIQ